MNKKYLLDSYIISFKKAMGIGLGSKEDVQKVETSVLKP